jgi:Ni/Co efflux regulator RcnB
MFKHLILASTLGLGLAVSPALMAHPGYDRDQDRGREQHDRDDQGDAHRGRDNRDGRHDHRYDDRKDHRYSRDDDRRHDRDHSRHDDREVRYRDDRRDYYRNVERDHNRHDDREVRYRYQEDRRDHYRSVERDHRYATTHYRVVRYQPPRGYVRRQWRTGEHIPSSYCENRYVVHDYRSYRLHAPPRGYHWVRVDHDVVLTAITTGFITAVVYGIFS